SKSSATRTKGTIYLPGASTTSTYFIFVVAVFTPLEALCQTRRRKSFRSSYILLIRVSLISPLDTESFVLGCKATLNKELNILTRSNLYKANITSVENTRSGRSVFVALAKVT